MTRTGLLRIFYLTTLCGVGFSLPLSVWFTSMFSILALLIFIIGGGWRSKGQIFNEKKSILVFLLFYLVYLAWMINTSDVSYGLKELKIKLPLLIFPIVIGLSDPLTSKEIKYLLSFFIAGVVVSSTAGAAVKLPGVLSGSTDPRELSLFISSIRMALMTVAAIFSSGWYFLSPGLRSYGKFFYGISFLWLVLFLFFLASVTGIIIFLFLLLISFIALIIRSKNILLRYLLVVSIFLIVAAASFFVLSEIKSFYSQPGDYPVPLEEKTANGRKYQHNIKSKDIESGNKVWIYINEEELKNGWNSRSSLSFDTLDLNGQVLKYTLIRYMTSAGLRKDSLGITRLTESDIINVEHGMTNRLFSQAGPLRSKLYEIIWQVDFYRNGGNPSGNSVTQRLEFLKTGWHIFLRAPVFGTGTGDLKKEFELQYNLDNSVLHKKYRLISHNQYLTFLVSFGLTGFLIICFAFLYPLIKHRVLVSYLPLIFCLILFLSMLNEDTLETHTGVTFFAYFYSLFIFGKEDGEKDERII